MHYKNQREVKIGDIAVKRSSDGSIRAGLVVSLSPGATSCNLGLATWQEYILSPGQTQTFGASHVAIDHDGKAHLLTPSISTYETCSEYLHADDALKAFEKLESALP